MRIGELLARCRREMESRGLSPDPDSEIFVSALAKVPRSRLRVEPLREAGDLVPVLREWIGRRASGEPLLV